MPMISTLESTQLREDVFAVGHLRHRFGRDETHRVEMGEARFDQRSQILHFSLGRNLPRKPCQASRGHSISLTIFPSWRRTLLQKKSSPCLSSSLKKKTALTIVTLNRPERRNALTIELMSELADAIDNTTADDTQRILILRGAGPGFCAGLDLKETTELEKAHRSAEMVAETLLAISQTRLITIAQIHGAAVAGGAGLMSACDFVVAAEGTKIGYPETKRGLVAGLVMTFLRRQLRERDIRELLFTADLINAERAREIGLVNRVVSPNELENETQKMACGPAKRARRSANTKRLIEELWASSVKKDVETALRITWKRASPEAKKESPLSLKSARRTGRRVSRSGKTTDFILLIPVQFPQSAR